MDSTGEQVVGETTQVQAEGASLGLDFSTIQVGNLTLTRVPTGNGGGDLWRDSERRAYFDGSVHRITVRDLKPEAHGYSEDPQAEVEVLRENLAANNLTVLLCADHGGIESRVLGGTAESLALQWRYCERSGFRYRWNDPDLSFLRDIGFAAKDLGLDVWDRVVELLRAHDEEMGERAYTHGIVNHGDWLALRKIVRRA